MNHIVNITVNWDLVLMPNLGIYPWKSKTNLIKDKGWIFNNGYIEKRSELFIRFVKGFRVATLLITYITCIFLVLVIVYLVFFFRIEIAYSITIITKQGCVHVIPLNCNHHYNRALEDNIPPKSSSIPLLVAPVAHQQSDLSSHCGVCLLACLFVDRLFFAIN